jgi:hypothetical protein
LQDVIKAVVKNLDLEKQKDPKKQKDQEKQKDRESGVYLDDDGV